jgi:dTDP-4-amino-4,6-dideoxygalactose transaminase
MSAEPVGGVPEHESRDADDGGLFDFDERDLSPVTAPEHERPLAILGGEPTFPDGVPFARPARPALDDVMRRVAPAYESGILTNGALVAELEELVAARLHVDYAVAVSSCTSGLILALQALVEDRPGPVVMPSFTFMATGLAATWNNRPIRLVGCDAATFQLDLAQTAAALDGASALVATHVFGAPCRPAAVDEIATLAGVPVLYDAAHAFGATSGGEPAGRFGAAEVFSLTPTKVLVAGEGGLITTGDADLAERLRAARNYGNRGDYDAAFPGLNARLSEFHAAMALESLAMFDSSLRGRRRLAALYRRCLDGVPGVKCQSVPVTDESTFKDFAIRIDENTFGMTRDHLVEVLAAEGIETRNYFDPPLHTQTVFADAEWGSDLSVVDLTSRTVTCLPIYPDLPADAAERIVEVIALAHEHADEIVTGRSAESRASRSQLRLSIPTVPGA